MNSLATQAILGAAVLTAVAAAFGSVPFAGVLVAAAVAFVAFVAQSQRLRDEEDLVYRPVPVRRHGVQHRVRSDD